MGTNIVTKITMTYTHDKVLVFVRLEGISTYRLLDLPVLITRPPGRSRYDVIQYNYTNQADDAQQKDSTNKPSNKSYYFFKLLIRDS